RSKRDWSSDVCSSDLVPTLDLMVWLSLVPPAPALLLALALDGPGSIAQAVTGVTWRGLAAIVYLGAVATVVAYAIWGDLLRRYRSEERRVGKGWSWRG